jgi:hypothetical protein
MHFNEEQVRAAVERSGYPLEQRVAAACAAMGFDTTSNGCMLDPATGKAREFDVTARWIEARDQIWTRPGVGAILPMECARCDTPLVFYEKGPSFWDCGTLRTVHGYPLYLSDPPGSSGYSRLEDCAGISSWSTVSFIATQWHGFDVKNSREGPQLKASQRHDLHSTFEKLIVRSEQHAQDAMRPGLIEAGFLGGCLTFIRPVLVIQGSVRGSRLESGEQPIEERGLVHYLRTSFVQARKTAWLIDVVNETDLTGYLAGLLRSMATLRQFCLDHRERVQAAIRDSTAQRLCMMNHGPRE